MNRGLAVLLLILLVPSLASGADQSQPIKLDLACTAELASQRNLTIRASEQQITTATYVVSRQAGLGRFRANFNASYYRLNAPITLKSETVPFDGTTITIPGQTVADQNVTFANIQALYPLYDAGRVRYNVRSAQYSVAEAQNNAADTQLSVVLQSTNTYLAAIYGRENVSVNQESLRSYEAHLASTQSMRREGVATDYDVIRAESAVEDQRKRLANATNQYELALANLRTSLLLPKDAPIDLQGGFFDVPAQPPVDQAEESAVQASPLVKSLADRACSFFWSAKSVKAELKPQLDTVGFGNLLPRSSGFLTNAQWFVGIQLSQTIFDAGVTRARAAELLSEQVTTNTQLEGTSNEVRLSVRSAYLDMSTACSAIAAARKSVELARESLRLAERRFAEGVGTSLEVLDANINLLAAQTGLQQSLYQLDSAYLTAHRYLGDIMAVTRCAQSAGSSAVEGRSQ